MYRKCMRWTHHVVKVRLRERRASGRGGEEIKVSRLSQELNEYYITGRSGSAHTILIREAKVGEERSK
jgi:hypothetical protein